jgi:hypothetical protein
MRLACSSINIDRVNYSLIYERLIEKAKSRTSLEGYTEKHHVIPKCMGGSDDPNNLVALTPEEHYVAHQLLVKIYPNNSLLVFAAHKMCCGRFNNKLYGWLKRKHALAIGKHNSIANKGSNNHCFNMKWIHNPVLRQSKRINKTDIIPEGWRKGRVINFDSFNKRQELNYQKQVKKATRKKIKQEKNVLNKKRQLERQHNKQVFARKLYNIFLSSGCRSVRDFLHAQKEYNYSLTSLCKLWKKFIPEYTPIPRKCYKG